MRWFSCCVVILVVMAFAGDVGTDGNADPQKRFSEWMNERVRLEKEQHGFHRGAHAKKLAEKRGMNIPDGKTIGFRCVVDMKG